MDVLLMRHYYAKCQLKMIVNARLNAKNLGCIDSNLLRKDCSEAVTSVRDLKSWCNYLNIVHATNPVIIKAT